MSRSRNTVFFLAPVYSVFDSVAPAQTNEISSRSQGGGCVMVLSSSSAASARVAIALQSVNTSEASKCQLL